MPPEPDDRARILCILKTQVRKGKSRVLRLRRTVFLLRPARPWSVLANSNGCFSTKTRTRISRLRAYDGAAVAARAIVEIPRALPLCEALMLGSNLR